MKTSCPKTLSTKFPSRTTSPSSPRTTCRSLKTSATAWPTPSKASVLTANSFRKPSQTRTKKPQSSKDSGLQPCTEPSKSPHGRVLRWAPFRLRRASLFHRILITRRFLILLWGLIRRLCFRAMGRLIGILLFLCGIRLCPRRALLRRCRCARATPWCTRHRGRAIPRRCHREEMHRNRVSSWFLTSLDCLGRKFKKDKPLNWKLQSFINGKDIFVWWKLFETTLALWVRNSNSSMKLRFWK